jgi:drug/metabolite transporter (DMT)-like permease
MLASAATFSVMSTLIKYLGSDYPAALQTFYRGVAGFVILLPWILKDIRAAYRTSRAWILIYRSAVGTAAMILSFYSFQKLPLADANALSFTRTLWLVPLAYFLLREKVGPARIAAALVGFGGVLLMLQSLASEGHGHLGLPQIAGLAAAAMFATTITGMKSLTRDHNSFTLLVWAATLGFVFALPGAVIAWRWPTPLDLFLLCLMGAIGTLTQYCYIRGMQVGDAAAMAPIDYTRLVFTALIGFLAFHEVPRAMTIAGAAIVVASTLFITWREHVAAHRDPEHPLD